MNAVVSDRRQRLRFEFGDRGCNSKVVASGGTEVFSETLTEILDREGAPTAIELLTIDVEGHEMEALRGIDFERYCFECLIVEANGQREPITDRVNRHGCRLLEEHDVDLYFVCPHLDPAPPSETLSKWKREPDRASLVPTPVLPLNPSPLDSMIYPNPQIYPPLQVIFVHVPKTAGTAIERALRERPEVNVGGHTTALGFRRKFPEEFASYFNFAVVRHPVSRFLSAWRYLRGSSVHPALYNAEIHECGSFENWMRRVRDNPGLLERIVHLHPQHRFVCGEAGEVLVDRIYRYEELDPAWMDTCARLGLPHAPLPKLNPSRRLPDLECPGLFTEWIADHYRTDFLLGGYKSAEVSASSFTPPPPPSPCPQ